MPYRRSYRRGGYRRRYPRRGNGRTDYVKMAKMAYSGVKYLKGLVNVEKHALQIAGSYNPDNTTGQFQCLNLIAQGDAEADRSGDSIMLKQVLCNLKYTINSSATATAIRTIIFFYRQPQGATPTITFPLATATHLATYNHDNVGLYTILYDKTVNLSITGQQERTVTILRKFYQLHETFDGSGATVADIQTNSLWIMFVSDEPTNTPSVILRAQTMFIDN